MISTITFLGVLMLAEAAVVWLAYCMGHSVGWCEGAENRQAGKNRTA
jgi:hypothetical protein